jgi:hypothetical protein
MDGDTFCENEGGQKGGVFVSDKVRLKRINFQR